MPIRSVMSVIALTASLAFAVPSTAQAQPIAGQPVSLTDVLAEQMELVEALQKGGLVLLFRHERTEVPSRPDDYNRPPEECRAQRNLSVAGMSAAQENGNVLRALEIPVGRVLASPMCRGIESARFMFGVGYETDTRLLHHDPAEGAERGLDAAEAELRDLLTELAPGTEGSNIALISHGAQIFRVTGRLLSEGEMAILKLDADGSVEVLGNLMVGDLSPYARRKLAQEAGQE